MVKVKQSFHIKTQLQDSPKPTLNIFRELSKICGKFNPQGRTHPMVLVTTPPRNQKTIYEKRNQNLKNDKYF